MSPPSNLVTDPVGDPGKSVNAGAHAEAIRAGLDHHRQGNLAAAESAYRQVLKGNPDHPDALHWLGVIALQMGQAEQARRLIARAVELNPDDVAALSDLGNAEAVAGDFIAAEETLRRATEIDPRRIEAWSNLGSILKSQRKLDEAEEAFRHALQIDSDFAQIKANLASVLIPLGQSEEAAQLCREAVQADPGMASAYANLSAALNDLGEVDAAIEAAEEAVRLAPGLAEGHSNLSVALQAANDLETAERFARQAIALSPQNAEFHYNLGNILYAAGNKTEAIAALEKSLALDPGFADAHLSLGRIRLRDGDLSGFWDVYRRRWQSRNYVSFRRQFPQPHWEGQPIEDKGILIWGEQGIGDEILFAGLIPEIAARARLCVVETEERLVPLFARSFENVQVVARRDEPHPATRDPSIDYQVPMADLGQRCRPNLDGFAPLGRYLKADPGKAGELRDKYNRLGNGPIIGISWHSRVPKLLPLADWGPILENCGATFISLQYGDHRDELSAFAERHGVMVHGDPEIDPLADMDGFAAQVEAMDLVVTIDNSTLAIAAALGGPVFGLVPLVSDWRYSCGPAGCPWHDNLTLFRQHRSGIWDDAIREVSAAVSNFVRNSGQHVE